MAFEPNADTWNEPCDLCGAIRYDEGTLDSGIRILRCRECGLTALIEDGGNGVHAMRSTSRRLSPWAVEGLLRAAVKERARSTLLIVENELPSEAALKRIGGRIIALRHERFESARSNGMVTHVASLANAPFMADQFDLIICLRPIELFPSPALLLEKARTWLTAGGTLLIAGFNNSSLPRRLWRRDWLRAHSGGAQRLLTSSNVRGYADRYGFEVRRLRTHSQPNEVMRMPKGDGGTSVARMLFGAVTAVTANALNIGDVFIVSLMKAGVAMRPLSSRVDAQEERSPGLAPAMYTGTRREF